MIRRRAPLAACFAVLVCILTARPASADMIGLTAPLGGNAAAGTLLDLTVTFDLNGSPATNLVGLELYIAFTGLTPVAGSYQLGSVFTPFMGDVLGLDGVCADRGCNYPPDDQFSPSTYLSLVSVFAPSEPSGPGGLFTLQFTTSGTTPWSLNVFGDDTFGLLWDPPAVSCAPDDADCDPDPVIAPIPFVVARGADTVPGGIARINVDVPMPDPGTDPTGPLPVPEPASVVLLASGLAALIHLRRRPQP